jgi:hypothetical protein
MSPLGSRVRRALDGILRLCRRATPGVDAVEVDLMIASLRATWSEVTIMGEAGARGFEGRRDRSSAEDGFRVACHVDH